MCAWDKDMKTNTLKIIFTISLSLSIILFIVFVINNKEKGIIPFPSLTPISPAFMPTHTPIGTCQARVKETNDEIYVIRYQNYYSSNPTQWTQVSNLGTFTVLYRTMIEGGTITILRIQLDDASKTQYGIRLDQVTFISENCLLTNTPPPSD